MLRGGRRTTALSLALLLGVGAGTARAGEGASFDHDHASWDALLDRFVEVREEGVTAFDYDALAGDEAARTRLDRYLEGLAEVSPKAFRGWSEAEQLAFLVNAYNAYTVKLVVEHHPVETIKDLGGWLSSPWEEEWAFIRLLGDTRTLDGIEHGLIRGRHDEYDVAEPLRVDFEEPRIHFAVNCASVGCPALRPEAYVRSRLDEQLAEAAEAFLAHTPRNCYDPERRTLYASPLFDWYGEDFAEPHGSWRAFVAPHVTEDPSHRKAIAEGRVEVVWTHYDWKLNAADDPSRSKRTAEGAEAGTGPAIREREHDCGSSE